MKKLSLDQDDDDIDLDLDGVNIDDNIDTTVSFTDQKSQFSSIE